MLWVDGTPPRDRVKGRIAEYIATRTMRLFHGRNHAISTRRFEIPVYCTRRAQDFGVQKLEGHGSDSSLSSGSISQPSTRRSEPEANLFRVAPRHSSTAGGQEINFQDQQPQEDMFGRKFGCPGLLCDDAEAEVICSMSPWSGGLQLRYGTGEDTSEMHCGCRRTPVPVDEFVR